MASRKARRGTRKSGGKSPRKGGRKSPRPGGKPPARGGRKSSRLSPKQARANETARQYGFRNDYEWRKVSKSAEVARLLELLETVTSPLLRRQLIAYKLRRWKPPGKRGKNEKRRAYWRALVNRLLDEYPDANIHDILSEVSPEGKGDSVAA